MSIGKSIFDVIEHLFYGGNFTHPNRPGWVKRQYFRFSTRSSGEKLTIFVNLYYNTDLDTGSLPGGRPYPIEPPSQIPWPGVLSSPTH